MPETDIESLWAEEHGELVFFSTILKDIAFASIDEGDFYKKLLNEVNKILPVELAFLLLKNPDKKDLEMSCIFLGDKTRLLPGESDLAAEKYLARWAFQIKETVILNNKIINIKIEDPFSQELAHSSNTYLFSPQIYKGNVHGVLGLINKKKGTFNLGDKLLAEAAANLVTLFNQTNDSQSKAMDQKIAEMSILQDMPSGFVAFDNEGKILMVNSRAKEIFELPEKVTDMYFYEILPLNRGLFKRITQALNEQRTEQREFSTLTLESKKKIGYSTFTITDENNKSIGLGLIFQDLTKARLVTQV